MADMRRQQQHIALLERHVPPLSVLDDAERDVALDLVEKLFERIVVVVGALVGPADDRDHEIGILPDLGIADRRLQQVTVLVDPFLEIEWGDLRHRCLHHVWQALCLGRC